MRPGFAVLRRIARRTSLGTAGVAALELAMATPMLFSLILGAVDFGSLFNSYEAIAAAARAGAEYARDSATCKSSTTGIQMLPSVTIGSACTTGIENAMQYLMSFSPNLTYPAKGTDGSPFPLTCYCDKAGTLTLLGDCTKYANYSCAANNAGANAVFITVSASQAVTPPGFPTSLTLNGLTEVRLQ